MFFNKPCKRFVVALLCLEDPGKFIVHSRSLYFLYAGHDERLRACPPKTHLIFCAILPIPVANLGGTNRFDLLHFSPYLVIRREHHLKLASIDLSRRIVVHRYQYTLLGTDYHLDLSLSPQVVHGWVRRYWYTNSLESRLTSSFLSFTFAKCLSCASPWKYFFWWIDMQTRQVLCRTPSDLYFQLNSLSSFGSLQWSHFFMVTLRKLYLSVTFGYTIKF